MGIDWIARFGVVDGVVAQDVLPRTAPLRVARKKMPSVVLPIQWEVRCGMGVGDRVTRRRFAYISEVRLVHIR